MPFVVPIVILHINENGARPNGSTARASTRLVSETLTDELAPLYALGTWKADGLSLTLAMPLTDASKGGGVATATGWPAHRDCHALRHARF